MHQSSNTQAYLNKKSSKRVSSVNKKQRDKLGLEIKQINPLTHAQTEVFELFPQNHMVMIGAPGTGKTYISIALGLKEVMEYMAYNRIVIVRSAVPTRDLGFLPGTLEEKIALYEAPYIDIVSDLFGRGDAYDILKNKGVVQFMSTSFVRGLTIDNAIVIFDEFQNATTMELHSIITRIGKNTKLVLSGDIKQNDLVGQTKKGSQSGAEQIIEIAKKMKSFEVVQFRKEDIIRSGFVKEYLIVRDDLEERGLIEPVA